MRLKDEDGIDAARLPLDVFKAHLRLGTGFGEDNLQDVLLEAVLRAAIVAIEARTGKVLLERNFTWQLSDWRDTQSQALPVAPVNALTALILVTRSGDQTTADLGSVALLPSTQRPVLQAVYTRLPMVPTHGYAEVQFTAGYAADWAGLPADLAQAVLLLAAHFYETRHEGMDGDGAMPAGVRGLIERYRTVRILGGSAA